MKTILVAVDFSEGTGRLINQAASLGKELVGSLCVIHVTSDALQAAYESTQFYDIGAEFSGGPLGFNLHAICVDGTPPDGPRGTFHKGPRRCRLSNSS